MIINKVKLHGKHDKNSNFLKNGFILILNNNFYLLVLALLRFVKESKKKSTRNTISFIVHNIIKYLQRICIT